VSKNGSTKPKKLKNRKVFLSKFEEIINNFNASFN
jgi:hypothetical protein